MTDYKDYFNQYTELATGETALEALSFSSNKCIPFFQNISEELGSSQYKKDKWTIKQVLGHVIDTERIFACRALRFARQDITDLPGYDEKIFAGNSGTESRPVSDLVNEFELVRESSVALYQSFTPDMLEFSGTANGMAIDVTRLGFLIAGHSIHHKNILVERYGINE